MGAGATVGKVLQLNTGNPDYRSKPKVHKTFCKVFMNTMTLIMRIKLAIQSLRSESIKKENQNRSYIVKD